MSCGIKRKRLVLLVLAVLAAGCGRSEETRTRPEEKSRPVAARAAKSSGQRIGQASVDGTADPAHKTANPGTESTSLQNPPAYPLAPVTYAPPPRPAHDDAKITAAGIRRLSGSRLTLYTDLPQGEEIDRLPEVFEQAFPLWCDYFDVDPDEHPEWRATGCLMKDKERFEQAGLLPEYLPPFPHGFNQGNRLWFYDQASDYYRRHLLVHEGTHAFMDTILGGSGPQWYKEGMAEMLATHRWRDGHLSLGQIPATRDESPYWGRVRIIKDAMASGKTMTLDEVINLPGSAYLEVEAYAWSWAAVVLLDRHPRYRDRFHQMQNEVLRPDFNDRFRRLLGTDWGSLAEEWLLFVRGMEYGYDIGRTTVDFTPGNPLPPEGKEIAVAADRGWQNSGLRLERGKSYRLTASGRYQVAAGPPAWASEPGGVSIRYYQGRPLGVLLAAIREDKRDADVSGNLATSELLRPEVVGLEATLSPKHSGTLYLKINDSAAELADNEGRLVVEIRAE